MEGLIYPEFDYRIEKQTTGVKIFDIIRKKMVVLTPEEWVRQHIIHHLINDLGYPKTLIKVETGLNYNKQQKRADIIAYNRQGRPYLLIECKAENINLSQLSFAQVASYNSQFQSKFVMLSNGKVQYIWQVDYESRSLSQLDNIPPFPA